MWNSHTAVHAGGEHNGTKLISRLGEDYTGQFSGVAG